tara:strand:- start:115 stop:447 length:333 start_codon:yes stop_codon:yes gene_type:complete
MARYMAIIEASPDAFKGLIQTPEDRREKTKPLFSATGMTLEHYWFGVGSNLLYIVMSGPDDDVTLEAITMLVHSSGISQSVNVIKLMTSKEAVASMHKARELAYSPPTAN